MLIEGKTVNGLYKHFSICGLCIICQRITWYTISKGRWFLGLPPWLSELESVCIGGWWNGEALDSDFSQICHVIFEADMHLRTHWMRHTGIASLHLKLPGRKRGTLTASLAGGEATAIQANVPYTFYGLKSHRVVLRDPSQNGHTTQTDHKCLANQFPKRDFSFLIKC